MSSSAASGRPSGGTGTVAGYGEATTGLTITSYTWIPGTDCFAATATATIAFANGSTLTYEASGIWCPVGNSRDASGSVVSYGNPWTATGTFTITGGTGVFVGARGSGTLIDYSVAVEDKDQLWASPTSSTSCRHRTSASRCSSTRSTAASTGRAPSPSSRSTTPATGSTRLRTATPRRVRGGAQRFRRRPEPGHRQRRTDRAAMPLTSRS